MNKSEATKLWFKAAGIRAIKTVCQTAIATIGIANPNLIYPGQKIRVK